MGNKAATTTRTVRLSSTRTPTRVVPTDRTAEVVRRFGIGPDAELSILDGVRVSIGPGRIVAFCGPSGSGKSTALGLIESRYASAHNVARVCFPADTAIVDSVIPGGSLADALEILSLCALGEARLWLRRFSELSDGERFRASLAKAIGAAVDAVSAGPLIVDEFASGLHRRAAKAMAYNLRKLADRRGLSVVLATNNDDVLADLQADTIVTLSGRGQHRVDEHARRRKPLSLWRRLRIEPGRKRDYEAFGWMHYRQSDELGFVDKVFVLREGAAGELLGIVVYSHSPRESALRNQATGGRFVRNLKRLNHEMRILRRVVIHPDLRGCGVGHRLVRRTLPEVGTRFVECLASMGQVNPVFAKAGMKRIGQCEMPARRLAMLEELRAMEVDPFARGFESQVCRRPRVRAIVAGLVHEWYRATTAEGDRRVARQSPQFLARIFRSLVGTQPVYYLWEQKKD